MDKLYSHQVMHDFLNEIIERADLIKSDTGNENHLTRSATIGISNRVPYIKDYIDQLKEENDSLKSAIDHHAYTATIL